MGYRLISFAPGHIYHICQRGVAQQDIFHDNRGRQRFINLLTYYLPRKKIASYSVTDRQGEEVRRKALRRTKAGTGLVDLLSYCLMDNHVHLLLRENTERGISAYLQRVFNSYARYFNTRHERSGPLFTGRFKAVMIDGDEQFLHVTRYIHLNPFVAGMIDDPLSYRWSSAAEYMAPERQANLCHTQLLKSMLPPKQFGNFIIDYADYARELAQIKHLTLD